MSKSHHTCHENSANANSLTVLQKSLSNIVCEMIQNGSSFSVAKHDKSSTFCKKRTTKSSKMKKWEE